LKISGDPEVWRKAGVPVSIIMTPETARGGITGPAYSSLVIRLAYEGDNLYLQAIAFDDVITFHQPIGMMYLQDGLEISINSFMQGLKFNLGMVDGSATVKRDKFVAPDVTKLYTEAEVPHSITIYKDAADFPERKLVEDIYGVDLANSPVVVYELKLPLNETGAFAPPIPADTVIVKEVAPGRSFRLGFFANDNDIPGSDIQGIIAFPATYGTFETMDKSAEAIFE
jgi:hypothetical protein